MRKCAVQVIAILLSAIAVAAATASGWDQRKSEGVAAFVNVNVIPMDRERALNNQTVLVRDGLIAEIGDAAKVKVPTGALQIDGRGKYLIPGLIDMHVHLFSDDQISKSFGPDELIIMLANGVTTVRFMNGTPEQLDMRDSVSKGRMLGPTIYAASPQITGHRTDGIFNGRVVTSPEQARQAVMDFKAAGYDFIKITNYITRPVYDAVTEAAKAAGMRVIGHVDTQVGAPRAIEAGQQIEHLDGYIECVLKDDSPIKTSVSDVHIFRKANWESLDYIDPNKLREIAQRTASAGIYSTPTLTFFKVTFGTGVSDEEIRSRPDFRFVPSFLRDEWFSAGHRIWASPPGEERRRTYVRVRNQLVKEIHDAGGKIMAGSDSPDWFLLYGWSLHRELRSLVDAGLSAYAALEAATRTPAEYLRGLETFGTIEPGKRADLVLLAANPLDNIANTERRVGLMVRGRWFTEAQLHKLLDELAPRFQAAPAAGN